MFLVPLTLTEKIEEFVAELIVSNEDLSARNAISAAIGEFPNAKAIDAVFAFVSMASALEQPLFDYTGRDAKLSAELYRSIAILVADIYAVERLRGWPVTCAQLSEFWVETDETFFIPGQAVKAVTNLT
ncbi:hypothetical protein AAFO92_19290 [Roseovarius sp. CAU 1744]|uniref:hypothetical protein n=1 Tax=Roseovarius sp. CAU 1744 TaxID=3140368 RepID=UPI00325B800D